MESVVYSYQGTVSTLADLPSESTLGYTYFVSAEGKYYYWDESEWVHLVVAEPTAEFQPSFTENIVLYRGIETLQLDVYTGQLIASWIDGQTAVVGPITGYYYAKLNDTEGRIGTFDDWVQILLEATANAKLAEKWAVGTESEGTPSSTNNAYYWNTQSASFASAASSSADAAANSSLDSESWAVGTRNGVADPARATDNSKYYAETSGNILTNVESLASQTETNKSIVDAWMPTIQQNRDDTVAAAAVVNTQYNEITESGGYTERAETAAENAEMWATGSSSGTPSATNNAKYYADSAAEDASETAEAKAIVLESTTSAQAAAEYSEAWAQFTRNGVEITDSAHSSGAYNRNSKYWAGQSANSAAAAAASAASVAGTETLVNNTYDNTILPTYNDINAKHTEVSGWAEGAQQDAASASTYAQDAMAWATGVRNGSQVAADDPAYENNASYYASLAGSSATSAVASAASASISASEAAASAAGLINPTIATVFGVTSDVNSQPRTWSADTNPIKGMYYWTKAILSWGGADRGEYVTVTYCGLDGQSAVTSVNAKNGEVVLYSSDITLSETDTTTISTALQPIPDSTIDALFEEE